MAGMEALLEDLGAEHADLDAVVADLDEVGWASATPAEGWSVLDAVAHLAYFDGTATLAATDAEAFRAATAEGMADPVAFATAPHVEARERGGADLLERWRLGRARMLEAFGAVDPAARLPWYGPPMSARSFVTARLMETWAHGQDVVDGLGVERRPTDRLRHVAHIGVRARPFSYSVRGLPVPEGDVRVELVPPSSGQAWSWGEATAPDRVTGPALHFCLVATQRRHLADTDLVAEGPIAEGWLAIAQAFAGPPGPGRQPGQLPRP